VTTIYDIAKKTGFSVATVSKALNNYGDISAKTKGLINAAAEEMDYTINQMAKSLKTKKSCLIGVVIGDNLEIGPHFSSILNYFRNDIGKYGYDTVFLSKTLGADPISYYKHCLYRGIDGVLIASIDEDDAELLEFINSNIPKIVTDETVREIASVSSDNARGSKMAVEYLYSLGHTRIAALLGPQHTIVGKERYQGYLDAMGNCGLAVRDDWVISEDKFNFEAGSAAMNKLLKAKELPTAVIASSDLIAFAAVTVVIECGYSVPDDFSIIGFDDADFARYFNPELTTIRQNRKEIAKTAADALINMINGNKCVEAIRIPADIVIRNSCKKI
jgi:Transcriptional regulators